MCSTPTISKLAEYRINKNIDHNIDLQGIDGVNFTHIWIVIQIGIASLGGDSVTTFPGPLSLGLRFHMEVVFFSISHPLIAWPIVS